MVAISNEVSVANPSISLTGGTGEVVASFEAESFEDKVKLYNALQDSEKIEDHLNEVIHLKDVVFQASEVVDSKTGEVTPITRTILIDDKGRAISAASTTLASGLRTLFSILGVPGTWDKPLTIKVIQKRSRSGNLFYQVIPQAK